MQTIDIIKFLKCDFPNCQIDVNIQGNLAEIRLVGIIFNGHSKVKRQQMVYKSIYNLIKDGSLHAVTIKAYTPSEFI